MKKILFLFGILFLTASVQAQLETDPAKALKKAGKSLASYNLDNIANNDKLDEAVKLIAIAESNDATKGLAETWIVKGQIYNEILSRDLRMGITQKAYKSEYPDGALTAFNSFIKGYESTDKKFEKKDALSGLEECSPQLQNAGAGYYEAKKYNQAFQCFAGVLKIHDLLKENGMKSRLDVSPDDYPNQLYVAGLSALYDNNLTGAEQYLTKMQSIKDDKAAVYEALYKINIDKNPDAAAKYLEQGRQKFPEDSGLLFAEINHYLKLGKLEQLIDRLKQAIAKEPNNVSLYNTMGFVYDSQYQKETDSNSPKAKESFDLAMKYYNEALAKDPMMFDANYSIGALYFNQAANMTKEVNKLSDDFSSAGQKRYEELTASLNKKLDEALPYFQKAEMANPSDINTLQALKEIFVRKNDMNTSQEFKKRLEMASKGEKIPASFFKK